MTPNLATTRHTETVKRTLVITGVVVVLLVTALTLGAIWVWPRALQPDIGRAISSVATAVSAAVGFFAAAASAVAAVAAMRAAQQSDETATRATEALAFATAPKLKLRSTNDNPIPERLPAERMLFLWNSGRWPASNLRIELNSHDGHTEVVQLDKLPPSRERDNGWPANPETITFPMRRPERIGDPQWRGERSWTDKVVVTYSDERGFVRWRVTFPLQYSAHQDGRTSGISIGSGRGWGKEERVSRSSS